MTTHDKDGQPIPGRDRAREAERRRRMAKLRQNSARRTLEVIERKFPGLGSRSDHELPSSDIPR